MLIWMMVLWNASNADTNDGASNASLYIPTVPHLVYRASDPDADTGASSSRP